MRFSRQSIPNQLVATCFLDASRVLTNFYNVAARVVRANFNVLAAFGLKSTVRAAAVIIKTTMLILNILLTYLVPFDCREGEYRTVIIYNETTPSHPEGIDFGFPFDFGFSFLVPLRFPASSS